METENNSENLEDNLPMVSYIMLHRIYDILILMAKSSVPHEELEKMIKYHQDGHLLGPAPSYISNPENSD